LAFSVTEVEKKTVYESDLQDYLANHLSINEIQGLLQVKNRATAVKHISPKEMKLQELFIVPTDKHGRQTTKEQKQLTTRYYVSKNIWAEFLVEEGWMSGHKKQIVERFSFSVRKLPVGSTVRTITVVKTVLAKIVAEDVLNYLREYKRSHNISISPSKQTPMNQQIGSTTFKVLKKMCDSVTINAPSGRKLTYYKCDQLHDLYNCGFHKTDFIIPYNEEIQELSIDERFNFYLNEALGNLPEHQIKNYYDEKGELLPVHFLAPINRDLNELEEQIKKKLSVVGKNILFNELLVHKNLNNDEQTSNKINQLLHSLHNNKEGAQRLSNSHLI
jgi:hypothetical protein